MYPWLKATSSPVVLRDFLRLNVLCVFWITYTAQSAL